MEQEEVRLGVGLDAVALGRNIDHGVGGLHQGGGGGCLRDPPCSPSAPSRSLHPCYLLLLLRPLLSSGKGEVVGEEGVEEGLAEALQRAHSLHTLLESVTGGR